MTDSEKRAALEMELNEMLDDEKKARLQQLTPKAYEEFLDYFAKSPLSTATKNYTPEELWDLLDSRNINKSKVIEEGAV